jgi:SHS2 domain-containing protein
MKKYEQIDISGDVGLKIWGKKIEEILENSAKGMLELITDTSGVEETVEKGVALESENYEDLLVRWLNELVFLFDTYGFICRTFNINIQKGQKITAAENIIKLKAKVSGGIFDSEVNESRLLIKAATYHGLSVKKVNSHWEATVIFDI